MLDVLAGPSLRKKLVPRMGRIRLFFVIHSMTAESLFSPSPGLAIGCGPHVAVKFRMALAPRALLAFYRLFTYAAVAAPPIVAGSAIVFYVRATFLHGARNARYRAGHLLNHKCGRF
jgi:hypothetical protein